MVQMVEPQLSTIRKIYEMHEARQQLEQARPYLGASELGEACPRRLWYSFRWALRQKFDGRVLRMFGTGHIEEERIVQELIDAGVQVTGRQHEVVFANGHGKGHIDGAVLELEESPKTWHILEVKTHNAKSFADFVKKGVKKSKPKHYVQLQVYMGLTDHTRGAYVAENKDTDELVLERVEFDKKAFDAMMHRAQGIVNTSGPPEKISQDAAYFECKFCPFHELCHGQRPPKANCRTCAHSTPVADGKWDCAMHGPDVPEDFQRTGCGDHRFIPALVENIMEIVDVNGRTNEITWRNKLNGVKFTQPRDFSSHELAAAVEFRFIGSQELNDAKRLFDAKVVESGDAPRSDLDPIYGGA